MTIRTNRRNVLRGAAVATGLGLVGPRAEGSGATGFHVGRGVSDATGEVAECGLMGYGRFDQQAAGLHTRLRARSFVIADQAGGRVLLIVVDAPMIFESVHQRVLRRLGERFGDCYTEQNVLISATHTHSGPGGSSHHLLYNLTTIGFHEKTFDAVVDGIVESAERAHDDLAPAELTLTHDELHNASVNRSRTAFDRNPRDIKDHFPEAIDPQTSLLSIERAGRAVGAINWFPAHGTSMSGDNKLVSADNKGYAAYRWEREVEKVDYRAADPAFVAAFAQTNSGDMSPNLDLKPPSTPEDFNHTHLMGQRQYDAAASQLGKPGTQLSGNVDTRLVYVDLSDVTVSPRFTGDGKEHRTGKPAVGASMAAGSVEDGPAFPGFREGENPLWDAVSDSVIYNASPGLRESQAPKAVFAPVGEMNRVYPWVQEKVPVQLIRIGRLHLIGIPGEATIGAGLRLRRTVAGIVGADLADVLVAGYANSYFHYLTTPEEYDAQQYEGGSTLFGRWQLPALQQVTEKLAIALRDGRRLPLGPVSPDHSGQQLVLQPPVVADAPPAFRDFGEVLTEPRESYRAGEKVSVVFAGAHPGNDLHRTGTYLEVQRRDGAQWSTIADDGDWDTKFHWERDGIAGSKVTVSWDVPGGILPGDYRIRYHGDAKPALADIRPFSGTTRVFAVSR